MDTHRNIITSLSYRDRGRSACYNSVKKIFNTLPREGKYSIQEPHEKYSNIRHRDRGRPWSIIWTGYHWRPNPCICREQYPLWWWNKLFVFRVSSPLTPFPNAVNDMRDVLMTVSCKVSHSGRVTLAPASVTSGNIRYSYESLVE